MRIETKRTLFFKELSQQKQEQFFRFKRDKFLPAIDNIYYSLILYDDNNENENLKPLLEKLEGFKNLCMSSREEQEFEHGLIITKNGFSIYKYCLQNPDMYDIFISDYLPNKNTPRILVQIRSYGLWLYGADKMLSDSYAHVEKILNPYDVTINTLRENRIDYCYHTNAISNPEKVFADRDINKQMSTTMERFHQTGRIEHLDGNVVIRKDYFALGQRTSNNVFIRFYNKALEVIEQGYKGFFFKIWHDKGLINEYDKYCFEYAILHKNYDYVHKAKLQFYIDNGTNEVFKTSCLELINNPNATLKAYENLANSYMPKVTTVMNVEFETKRKFYYYSDDMIDNMLKYIERENIPVPMRRIYKIIDNRNIFLYYLTSMTVCFKKPDGTYAAWWERLRNTKITDCLDIDEKLLRDYSSSIDEKLAKVRLINAVATNAVYNDNIETDFISDVADVLSNINDNHKQKLNFLIYKCNDDGEVVEEFNSLLLNTYKTKKVQKERRLRNRKKVDEQECITSQLGCTVQKNTDESKQLQ